MNYHKNLHSSLSVTFLVFTFVSFLFLPSQNFALAQGQGRDIILTIDSLSTSNIQEDRFGDDSPFADEIIVQYSITEYGKSNNTDAYIWQMVIEEGNSFSTLNYPPVTIRVSTISEVQVDIKIIESDENKETLEEMQFLCDIAQSELRSAKARGNQNDIEEAEDAVVLYCGAAIVAGAQADDIFDFPIQRRISADEVTDGVHQSVTFENESVGSSALYRMSYSISTGDVQVHDGEINDSVPFAGWPIDAQEGQKVIVLMRAVGESELDTLVGILAGGEDDIEVLAENDDYLPGITDSQVTHTFEKSGTYIILATRYQLEEGVTFGKYQLVIFLMN